MQITKKEGNMTSYKFNKQKKLQLKLFKAAKAGEFAEFYKLTLEGANPFLPDDKGIIAGQYLAIAPRDKEVRLEYVLEEHTQSRRIDKRP